MKNVVSFLTGLAVVGTLGILFGIFSLDNSETASAMQAPRSCPARRTLCPAGREGNGGCYEFPANFCTDGRVCPRGSFVCRRGGMGVGGCYDPTQVVCLDGLRCARLSSLCRPGARGGGGCYDSRRQV